MSFRFPAGLEPLTPDFPRDVRADGLLLRTVSHDDVGAIAPAFTDPAVGGEAGLPPLDEEQLHAFLDRVLPQWRADGRVVPYVIEESGELLGGVTLHHLDPLRRAIEIHQQAGQLAGCRPAAVHVVQKRLGGGADHEVAAVRIDVGQQRQTLSRRCIHQPQHA